MNNNHVSIIIPIYNTEQYLRQCLESVINQTFKDIEIICVNDCSTDNSLQIIKEYKQTDNRIIIVNLATNVGAGFAKNEGLKIAKGKYITFIDSDDWIKKDYIEILYKNIETCKCEAVFANFYSYNDITKQLNKYYIPNNYYTTNFDVINSRQHLLTSPKNIWVVWSKIYNRNFLVNNNILFELKNQEDITFIYKTIIYSKKIKFINEHIYFYRTNRKNSLMSNSYFLLHYKIKALQYIKETLLNANLYNTYAKSFYTYSLLTLSNEFAISRLSNKRIKLLYLILKKDLLKDFKSTKIYIYSNLVDNVKLFCFKFCFSHNISYKHIGKSLRTIYFFIKGKHYKNS